MSLQLPNPRADRHLYHFPSSHAVGRLDLELGTKGVLARVSIHPGQLRNFEDHPWESLRDVEEAIFVLMFLIDGTHESSSWWQDLIDEDEDGLLGRKLDAFADHIDELAHCEIGRHQVLLLIDGRDI